MRKNKPPQERQFPRHSHSIPRHSTGGRQSTAPPASGGSMEGRKRTDSVPARRGRPVTGPLFSARPPGPASEAPAHHRARFHHLQEAEIILSPLLSYFNGSIPCPTRPVKPRPGKRRSKKQGPGRNQSLAVAGEKHHWTVTRQEAVTGPSGQTALSMSRELTAMEIAISSPEAKA